jgi:hypothetical protein
MITVNFYQTNIINDNIKPFSSWNFTPTLTLELVRNDNQNFTLHVDGVISVSSDMDTINNSDYIGIVTKGGFEQLCAISSIQYINDNKTNILYYVDYFSTAVHNNRISNAFGQLQRTFIDYTNEPSFLNLLPEPVSGNNTRRKINTPTGTLNNDYASFIGITNFNYQEPATAGYCYVLTVNNKVATFLANGNPQTGNSLTDPVLTETVITAPSPISTSSTIIYHGGGMYSGFPLVFTTLQNLRTFLDTLNNGKCVLRYKSETNDIYGQETEPFINTSRTMELSTNLTYNPIYEIPIIQDVVISGRDIINCKIIPRVFTEGSNAIGNTGAISSTIDYIDVGTYSTSGSVHGLTSSEDNGILSKLLTYPYSGIEIETISGDVIPIEPQTYIGRPDNVWTNSRQLERQFQFIGGDSARVILRIGGAFNNRTASTVSTYVGDDITVITFPDIPLTLDGTSAILNMNANLQMNKQSSVRGNYIVNQSTNITGGFIQGLRGYEQGRGAGWFSRTMHGIGRGLGWFSRNNIGRAVVAGLAGNVSANVQSQTMDTPINRSDNTLSGTGYATDIQTMQNTVNAGNMIQPTSYIKTNTLYKLLFQPPIQLSYVGYSNSEQFAVARFWERQGQSASGLINPFNGSQPLFGGLASVIQRRGQYYFKFDNMEVSVNLPTIYREAIIQTFVNGVYLI